MQIDKLTAMWTAYRSNGVNPKVHPADHMYKSNPKNDDYYVVGESAARVIHGILALAPTESIWRVLDFGCGHGRVARHIRSLFPQADLFFSDIDIEAAEFCAEQFQGTAVPSVEEFDKLDLPTNLGFIWVGSVFTHIDYGRMQALFDALFNALGGGGILIATFRGYRTYEITKSKPVEAKHWAPLLEQYETTGVGYQSYNRPELGDWGLSLTSIDKVVNLKAKHVDAKLIGYTETGWANVHDVGAWMKS